MDISAAQQYLAGGDTHRFTAWEGFL